MATTKFYGLSIRQTAGHFIAVLSNGNEAITFTEPTRKHHLHKLHMQIIDLLKLSKYDSVIFSTRDQFWETVKHNAPTTKIRLYTPDEPTSAALVAQARGVASQVWSDLTIADAAEAEELRQKLERLRVIMLKKSTANVYTDASKPLKGKGGCFGWVRQQKSIENIQFHIQKARGTTDALELQAIIHAVKAHRSFKVINIFSDSKNAIEDFDNLMTGNKGRNVAVNGKDRRLLETIKGNSEIVLTWVPSHSEEHWNVYADQLVRYGRHEMKKEVNADIIKEQASLILRNLAANRT